MIKKAIAVITLFTLFSCKKDSPVAQLTITDNFNNSNGGWLADFADYPVGEEAFYELKTQRTTLPAELKINGNGLLISGNNHSDDLFMYLKKQVKGLQPNRNYSIQFEVEFASNAAEGGFGVGGSTAESVYVGIGATAMEPMKIVDKTDNYYRMNIAKMNQSQDGTDMVVIGNVGNGTEDIAYNLVKRTGEFNAKTDKNGKIWLFIGTDSGFEATTTLYYTTIKTVLKVLK